MGVAPSPALARSGPAESLARNVTLWACSALHTVNDAFFAVIFPLLPLLATEFHLSYAEVGLVRTAFSTASSVFQLPVGLAAERWGEFALLVAGNGWVAIGLVGMGFATSYPALLGLTVLGGLGGNTQHPLAASLVSRAAPLQRRATAIGTLNFAGDLGKMCGPPLVALVAVPFGWRAALIGLGIFGVVFSILAFWLPVRERQPAADSSAGQTRGESPAPQAAADELGASSGWGIAAPRRFGALTLLGIVDDSTRGASLAFLPFVLAASGLDPIQVSGLFGVVFVGGACGKIGCGRLGDRLGPTPLILLTEAMTVASLVLFPSVPWLVLPLLALCFGFALNGTSSVLYAMVADLVPANRRARGYGLYYTVINGSSALAPVLYGLLGDQAGLGAIFPTMALVTALTLPLALVLRATGRRGVAGLRSG